MRWQPKKTLPQPLPISTFSENAEAHISRHVARMMLERSWLVPGRIDVSPRNETVITHIPSVAGCSNCGTQTVPDFFGRGMFTAPSDVVHGATCVGSFPSGDAWDAAGDTSVLPQRVRRFCRFPFPSCSRKWANKSNGRIRHVGRNGNVANPNTT